MSDNIDFVFKLQNLSHIKEVRLDSKIRIINDKFKDKLREMNPTIRFKGNDRN